MLLLDRSRGVRGIEPGAPTRPGRADRRRRSRGRSPSDGPAGCPATARVTSIRWCIWSSRFAVHDSQTAERRDQHERREDVDPGHRFTGPSRRPTGSRRRSCPSRSAAPLGMRPRPGPSAVGVVEQVDGLCRQGGRVLVGEQAPEVTAAEHRPEAPAGRWRAPASRRPSPRRRMIPKLSPPVFGATYRSAVRRARPCPRRTPRPRKVTASRSGRVHLVAYAVDVAAAHDQQPHARAARRDVGERIEQQREPLAWLLDPADERDRRYPARIAAATPHAARRARSGRRRCRWGSPPARRRCAGRASRGRTPRPRSARRSSPSRAAGCRDEADMARDRGCEVWKVATTGTSAGHEREQRDAGGGRLVQVQDVEVALAQPAPGRATWPPGRRRPGRRSRCRAPVRRAPAATTYAGRPASSSLGASTETS